METLLPRAKILIVDDEKLICQQVKILLNEFGYDAGYIYQPEILFDRLTLETFDLILMDVNMPKIDGIDLLKQLKQHPTFHKIFVIMLTADVHDELMASCFEAGATDFMNKPISKLALKTRVRAALLVKNHEAELERLVQRRTIELQKANKQLELLNKSFQMFVPKQFISHIISEQSVEPGQFKEETLSVLFTNIRSYNQLSENISLQENFDFLNTFFSIMESTMSEFNGFIDKFIGDSIMGVFNSPQSARDSVSASINILEKLKTSNEQRKSNHLDPISIGIGVNTGPVLLGLIESKNRYDSTIVGDTVNLASRIENITKKYGLSLLISHKTFECIYEADFQFREIDTVQVGGKSKPVTLYEVFDADSEDIRQRKMLTKEPLQVGIVLYKCQFFKEAKKAFFNCYKLYQEQLSLDYMDRCDWYYHNPPNDLFWEALTNDQQGLHRDYERHGRRYYVNTPCLIEDGTHSIAGHIVDMSQTGICIFSTHSFEVGQKIFITLFDPDEEQNNEEDILPFSCQIKRRWGKAKQWKLGVEILLEAPITEK